MNARNARPSNISDELNLAFLYSTADVFLSPSVQNNLMNTSMENLACGTSCVAFDTGGILDLLDHQSTGYLARAFDIGSLAEGLIRILQDNQRWRGLSRNARRKAKCEFELSLIAKRYTSLYRELVSEMRRTGQAHVSWKCKGIPHNESSLQAPAE